MKKIQKAIIAQIMKNRGTGYRPEDKAITGTKILAEAVKGTVDVVVDTMHMKSENQIKRLMRPVYCQGCGAKYEGVKGEVSTCPYCGESQIVNDK